METRISDLVFGLNFTGIGFAKSSARRKRREGRRREEKKKGKVDIED